MSYICICYNSQAHISSKYVLYNIRYIHIRYIAMLYICHNIQTYINSKYVLYDIRCVLCKLYSIILAQLVFYEESKLE